ncbi:MAG: hypothetical protein IJY28_02755 [Clostridia bacterium]|nr:hypothetical protein [Clostridia bacterium]
MPFSSVLQSTAQAVHDFGPGGDRSLECVGITVTTAVGPAAFSPPNVYRLYRRDPAQFPIDLPDALRPLADRLAPADAADTVRIADISRTGDGRWRLCVKLRTPSHRDAAARLYARLGCTVAPDPMTVDRIISDALGTDGTLIQLGAELGGGLSATPVAVKTYYSLRTGRGSDRYRRFPAPETLLPVVAEVWHRCGGAVPPFSDACVTRLADMGYHPFLLGLNQYRGGAELKLYHMLSPYVPARLRETADRALAIMGCPAPALTAGMDVLGLYLRGLACFCGARTQGWKLYFAAKDPV